MSATGGTNGGDGNGGTGGSADGMCAATWTCTGWSMRSDGKYERTCTDDNACGTMATKPMEGPVDLPALDLDYYKCKVEPIFDRGCAMLGCHGTEKGRAFRLYARGRLRNDEVVPSVPTCLRPTGPTNLNEAGTATVMCEGRTAHTDTEWQANFNSARQFMVGLSQADDSELLRQPVVGGKAHAGVHLFKKTDADYQTIAKWLSGEKLGQACNPGPN